MCIELLLILRDYQKMTALGRCVARLMFPTLGVIHIAPKQVDELISAYFAKLSDRE